LRRRARSSAGLAVGAFALISAAAGGASGATLKQVSLDEGLSVDPSTTTKPNVAYYDYINRDDCINGFLNKSTESLFYRFRTTSDSAIDKVLFSMDDSDCCTAESVADENGIGKSCFSINSPITTSGTIKITVFDIINACIDKNADVTCPVDKTNCTDTNGLDSRDLRLFFVANNSCVGEYETVLDLEGPSAPSIPCIESAEDELTVMRP